MKSGKPVLQLTIYYIVLCLVVALIVLAFPEIKRFLPLGGIESLDFGAKELMSSQPPTITWNPIEKSLHLGLSLVGVLVLMEPVAWIYMGARRRKGREQSFILTILLLPMVVAGIVMIIQNSLALAFSLAGIVAGVRFRVTLDDSLDAIYIFVAIGAGLAAGIEALEISIVVTVIFTPHS